MTFKLPPLVWWVGLRGKIKTSWSVCGGPQFWWCVVVFCSLNMSFYALWAVTWMASSARKTNGTSRTSCQKLWSITQISGKHYELILWNNNNRNKKMLLSPAAFAWQFFFFLEKNAAIDSHNGSSRSPTIDKHTDHFITDGGAVTEACCKSAFTRQSPARLIQ